MKKFDYDVLIIGSGASGGMAAWTLTRMGVRCLMLDAGPPVDLERERGVRHVWELPWRGFGRPGRFPHVTQADEFNANLWVDEKQNPYTYDDSDPYYWVRIRKVGGKTLVWGRASWRLSDYEFACRDHDGFGDNWPIRYRDIAPYYDRVEPLFHVAGRREGFAQIPDGVFIEDRSPDCESVRRFIASATRMNVPTTKSRVATGRLASSVNLLLPDALATARLRIVPNAMVREIAMDRRTGLASGASFLDRRTGREYHAKARVVVLGASCLESTRILLNSGMANPALGHYLFDQFYVKDVVTAIVRDAPNDGGGYIPRFRNLRDREKNFIRGYAFDFGGGFTPHARYFPLYGEPLRKQLETVRNAGFSLTTMGEVLPRFENHVRIDKDVKDAWGIPVLHIRQKYTDNEFRMAEDSMNVAEQLCRGAGFEILAKHPEMVPPGESIHELGTCRMGDDPRTSVLNRFNQSHDVKNLFVVDGSAFVSGGSQNPTLTIAALSMRASEHIAAQMRSGMI